VDLPRTQSPDAYPPELRERESRLIRERRSAAGVPPRDDQVVGFAISGGGIRSATFALGFFQTLAHLKLIRFIDLVSTVSGGGYFGSFLGRLYRRTDVVPDAATVEDVIAQKKDPRIVDGLRDGEKYMAPNGAGDLILAAAIFFRNFVAVHVVLAVTLLLPFLAIHAGERLLASRMGWVGDLPWIQSWPVRPTWASPLLAIAAAVMFVFAAPCGAAYWLVEPPRSRDRGSVLRNLAFPWLTLLAAFAGSVFWLVAAPQWPVEDWWRGAVRMAAVAVAASAALAAVAWAVSRYRAHDANDGRTGGQRRLLSDWFARALTWMVIFAALGLVDTIAGTLYLALSDAGVRGAWTKWFAGAGAGLLTVFAFGKQALVLFGGEPSSSKRPRIPVAVVAIAAAGSIVLAYLTTLATVSHAICWRLAAPAEAAAGMPAGAGPVSYRDLASVSWAALVTAVFALLFGQIFTFLNRSSYHAH
jgi:hypothetical protein